MIFVDTSFLFAFASSEDLDHRTVLDFFRTLKKERPGERFFTTNHVVFECITLARMRASHRSAVAIGDWLYGERIARIHWATPDEERTAFDYLRKYSDKRYSAVDCLSFVIMRKLGIREALTLDSDFAHRFIVLPSE